MFLLKKEYLCIVKSRRLVRKGGTIVPYFIIKKMNSERIFTLIQEALAINNELFLIKQTITSSGDIEVIIDGDNGVALEECIRISRHIEHNLDMESDEFSLTVTTPDIAKPIVHVRQYNKNRNRILEVHVSEQVIEGKLIEIKEEGIVLEYKTKEPKPKGKGKQTVVKQDFITFDTITKALVKIVF